MLHKLGKSRFLPVIFVWLFTLLLCFSRFSAKSRTWIDMYTDGMVFTSDSVSLNLENGDSYTTIPFRSYLRLPAGNYHFQWNLDCDGINSIHLFTTNGSVIAPDTFDIYPDRKNINVDFTIKDTCQYLGFDIDFKDGTFINIYNFRMYSPVYNDYRMTLVLIASLFSILWLLYCKGIRIHPSILLITAAVIYSSIPSFRDNISDLYDTSFHISRLWNLASGLQSGQFPVRCAGYTYNGYGAITSIFYPDLFLYPFALLLLIGMSTNYVMQCIFISLNIVSAIAMYQCAKRIFNERWTAVIASVLYVLAIYRIDDVYVRCALGEAMAFCFLPVLITGVWSVWFGDKKCWPLLTLGACCIFFSHMLTVFMCAIGIVLMFILYLPRLIREKRLPSLIAAALMSLFICLFQIVPMVDFMRIGVGPIGMSQSVAANSLSPAQLFLWGNGDMPVDPFDYTLSGTPAEPGMVLNLGVVIAIYFILSNKLLKKSDNQNVLRFALCGALGAYATTTLFPWSILAQLTGGFTDIIQYAWRFLMFPAVFFSLAGAYGYRQLSKDGDKAAIFALILAALMALPTLSTQTRFNDVYHYGEDAEVIGQSEYNLPETNTKNVQDRSVHLSDGMDLVEYEKVGNTIQSVIETLQPGQVTFPLFGFQGYSVRVNGASVPYTLSDNNRITLDLAAGRSDIHIVYAGKTLWRIADLISLIFIIAFAVIYRKHYRFMYVSTR